MKYCVITIALSSIFCLAACSSSGEDAFAPGDGGSQVTSDDGWIGAWATAPYAIYPAGPLAGTVPAPLDSLTTPGAFPDEQAVEQSFRMIANPTIGGDTVRLRLSNLLGNRDITFSDVRLALRAANASIVSDTDTPVTFNGNAELVLAPGLEAISDPISFSFSARQDIAMSFYVSGETGPLTWHSISFDTQYVTPQNAGNTTSDVIGTSFSETTVGWFFVSGIDVKQEKPLGTVVALGDSITDGAYQTPGTNTRWPDLLGQRLQAAGIAMGVLNEGINSNLVTQRTAPGGAPALERFDRDVLERPNVRSLIILEGTNDLGTGVSSAELIAGLSTLINRAHDAGICVVLGTILPRDDQIMGWDRASGEPERQIVNDWIRNAGLTGAVESVVDFDLVMGMLGDNSLPNPALYAPDLLHPNSVGFQAMADAIPLEMLVPTPIGSCGRAGQQ